MWEKNVKGNGCMYMYNWIYLLYSRNDHNLVNQKKKKKNQHCWMFYMKGVQTMNPKSSHYKEKKSFIFYLYELMDVH